MKNLKFIILAAMSIILFSCSDDDEVIVPINEEEVITTVKVTLINGGTTITLQSKDLDGDGPNAPVVTVSGNLNANTTYTGSVQFLNETVNPAEDITEEVEDEGADHQVFYKLTNSGGATFSYTDADANGKPIGVDFTLLTGDAGSGILKTTLRHMPNKSAAGVSTGDITNAGGVTDADVSFPVIVQ